MTKIKPLASNELAKLNVSPKEWEKAEQVLLSWCKNHPEVLPGPPEHLLQFLLCCAQAYQNAPISGSFDSIVEEYLEEFGYQGV